MKVFVAPDDPEVGKFKGVIDAFPGIWNGSVLDVGCRKKKLSTLLATSPVKYTGFDLDPAADIVGDLTKGLPFSDSAFNVVVALDILEHINDVHSAFDEICRVSNEYVVITLPNIFEIKTRLRILFGGKISDKYEIKPNSQIDRHRWIFNFSSALSFCHARGEKNFFTVKSEGCLVGPKRNKLLGSLTKLRPDLLSPHYMVLLKREKSKSISS